jgi:signal transduction histidine kinase
LISQTFQTANPFRGVLRALSGVLCILLLHSPFSLAAEENVFDIANLENNISVNQYLYTAEFTEAHIAAFEETQAEFVREQLITSLNGGNIEDFPGFNWQPNSADTINFSSENGLTWFYLSLKNSSNLSREILLEFANTDGVGWIEVDENGDLQTYLPGYQYYIGGRTVYDTEFVVPVEVAGNSSNQLVGFIYNVSVPRVANIRAWEPEAFRTERMQRTFSDGTYYGFLMALVIYNLTLAFVIRQIAYLYAGMFQLCVGFIVFISTGYSLLFLFPNNQILTIPIFGLAYILASIFSGLFSIAILQIKEYSERLYKAWMLFVIWGLVQIPLILLTTLPSGIEANSNRWLLSANALVFLASQGLHIYTLIYFWKKVSIAKYWFVAITLQVWMLMAWQLTSNFGVSIADIFKYLVQAFTIVNGAILTWLIGYSVREEQRNRITAQEEALANLKMASDIQHSKANFISTAGHDLRQPLQAIRLHIEALKVSASTNTASVLSKIENNIAELSALLNSLMNLSKSTSYIEQDRDEEFLLDDVLHNLVEEMEPFATQKNIAITCQEAPYLVRSSKVGITQILRNLLHNSIKFTRQGSVNISVEPIGDEVCIVITDTGPGIAEEDLDHIFTEFFQVNNTQSQPSTGMGIGLSIVQRLSESLDISIHVESEVGKGTEFQLKLKVSDTGKVKRETTTDPSSLNGLRVAVVHQSSERCTQLKDTLERWGAMALAWQDWDQLRDYVSRHSWRPHMLIMEKDLFEAFSEQSVSQQLSPADASPVAAYSSPLTLDIPTIVLSNSLSREEPLATPDRGSGSGRFHWFSEPLSPGVLRSFIQRVVIKPAA